MQPLKLRSLIEGFVQEKEWTIEQKRAALDAIGRYNEYGNHLRRSHNLMEIAHTLANITEAAEKFTLSETGETFDAVTIKRNMQELRKISDQFNKLAQEAHVVQQRMEALYEEGGTKLNRYFKINDINEDASPAISKIGNSHTTNPSLKKKSPTGTQKSSPGFDFQAQKNASIPERE